jgi:hypothetical protein
MRGLLVPIFGRFYKDLTNRYMPLEAEGMKRTAESTAQPAVPAEAVSPGA